MTREVEWNEEFNVGVELVDKAHRRLFSIVRRILRLTEDEKNNQWACVEGIKYFKSYTLEHFQQEEAYMRSINYPGYAIHKQLHDNLRENTIPVLEQILEKSDYSIESVGQFLGVCIGWLSGHIMVEDKAITGKTASKWHHEQIESESKALEEGLVLAMKEVFCQQARIFSDHYGGEDIGRSMIYQLVYAVSGGGRVRVVIALEDGLALSTVEALLGVSLKTLDRAMSAFIGLVLQQFLRSISSYFNVEAGTYKLAEETRIGPAAMQKCFQNQYPRYSLLLDTDLGRLAFCVEAD